VYQLARRPIENNLQITSSAVISSLSSSQGSTNGGTELVIAGNGFVDGSTTVTVDGTVAGIQFSPPIVTSVLAILLENPVPVMVKVVDDPSIVIGVMPDIFGVSAGS
jgi:hypothetical protein